MSSDSFLFSLLNLDRKSLFQHHNIYCDVCSRSITGIRRKCLTCADIDVCNDCYLRGAHLSQIKFGHNPSSCVFVEIHNQEQTDEFNNWMKGRTRPPVVAPSVAIQTVAPPAPTPVLPPHGPTHPPFPSPSIPSIPNPFAQPPPTIPFLPGPFGPSVPMMPIPTPRGPERPLFDPQIFPIHPTFPEYGRSSDYRPQRSRFDTSPQLPSRDDRGGSVDIALFSSGSGIDERRYLGNGRFGESLRDQLNNDPPIQNHPFAPRPTDPFHL